MPISKAKTKKEKRDSNFLAQYSIVFSGGGTAGSVTPLLNLGQTLAQEEFSSPYRFIFVGSKKGIEQELVQKAQLFPDYTHLSSKSWEYLSIPAGKLRRYFSVANLTDIFRIILAIFSSWRLLKKNKAKLVISAGSFVSVPLAWAAYLQRIPVLIHQQDVRPGLANKLMAPFAQTITVTFEKSLQDYGTKAIWTGNLVSPIKTSRFNRNETLAKYSLDPDKPLLLVSGGGTGSEAINNLLLSARHELLNHLQIIHLSGRQKMPSDLEVLQLPQHYQLLEFLPYYEVLALIQAADLVISRCGLGSLTELSFFAKPALLIPLPDTHQEDNAKLFAQAQAALVLNQNELDVQKLSAAVLTLLADKNKQTYLSANISTMIKTNANEIISDLIKEVLVYEK